MACTMACPKFKKGLKMASTPLGVKMGSYFEAEYRVDKQYIIGLLC
jgi:hypothetical protein